MNNENQICPDCIIELCPDSKKLGEYSKWLVCPICGHRERPEYESIEKTGRFIDRIRRNNRNINQFNKDEESDIWRLS